jgi:hypothetical protein
VLMLATEANGYPKRAVFSRLPNDWAELDGLGTRA